MCSVPMIKRKGNVMNGKITGNKSCLRNVKLCSNSADNSSVLYVSSGIPDAVSNQIAMPLSLISYISAEKLILMNLYVIYFTTKRLCWMRESDFTMALISMMN